MSDPVDYFAGMTFAVVAQNRTRTHKQLREALQPGTNYRGQHLYCGDREDAVRLTALSYYDTRDDAADVPSAAAGLSFTGVLFRPGLDFGEHTHSRLLTRCRWSLITVEADRVTLAMKLYLHTKGIHVEPFLFGEHNAQQDAKT